MAQHRLDPGYPDAVVVSTKLGVTDYQRALELARRDGLTKAQWLRAVVLRALERQDTKPPPGG